MTASLPPFAVLMLAGLLLPFLNGALRSAVLLVAPLATFAIVWTVPDGAALQIGYLGFDLVIVEGSALGRLFATAFALITFAGALFALNQPRTLELAAAFIYAGSAIGVVFAGDLITLFVFWEVMAIGSTLVIASAGPAASRAALRYAAIHFLGGVLLMAGIAGEVAAVGSIGFAAMQLDSLPRVLILVGFLVNAGAWPLAAWLPDAYPRSSWSGMVFLSAFTTKAAIYVLLRGFPGAELLVYVGLVMVVYGIVYGALENDIRRIVAYAIVNQVGFMVAGVGIGTEMALNGAAAHAFAGIFYKGLLLMATGSVLYATGRSRLTDLGGLARAMPVATACAIVGAMSISALPLTSGFVSKSMIIQAAADTHLAFAWYVLMAASAAGVLHAGLRLPYFTFFHRDVNVEPAALPWNMKLAMSVVAGSCIGLGAVPGLLYALLPFPVDYVPYTAGHVVVQLQLLFFAALAFFLLLRWLAPAEGVTLDVDWLWRGIGPRIFKALDGDSDVAWEAFLTRTRRTIASLAERLWRHTGPQGDLARTWATSSMAFWTTLVLAMYLIVTYL